MVQEILQNGEQDDVLLDYEGPEGEDGGDADGDAQHNDGEETGAFAFVGYWLLYMIIFAYQFALKWR